MKHVIRLAFATCLLSAASFSMAETRTEKIDRLYKFFNVQELNDFQIQGVIVRAKDSAKQATDAAIASVPEDSRTEARQKAEAALTTFNEKVSTLQTTPASSLWKAFLEQQLSDADLDNAVTFFSSPAGGRFMGVKGVADSIASTALRANSMEIIGSAIRVLEVALKSLPNK